jgi:hypothetical protein
MRRLALGGGLLLVAALMLLGFLVGDADPSAPATVAAILISVGIPAATGGWLIAKHFGLGRAAEERRERLRQDTLEAEVLRMAGRYDGRLTAVEVAGELGVPAGTAKELLDALMANDLADIEITESGVLVYAFHDVQHLSEKPAAKKLLDDLDG